MCLQRMWSISRDKDVPTKTMNRKVIDSQRVQGRVPQRRSLGVLGKDEVASSNLASSSKNKPHPIGWGLFLRCDRFEPLNAIVRWTVAGRVGPGHTIRSKAAAINLASSSRAIIQIGILHKNITSNFISGLENWHYQGKCNVS